MVGFFFRLCSQHRSSQSKLGRSMRLLGVRLARKRRSNRRALASSRALEAAVEAMEERNRRVSRELQLQSLLNSLANSLVHDCFVEVVNDPSMREAFGRIDPEILSFRNLTDMIPHQTFPGRSRRRR